jgi:phage tail-like protein
VTSIKDPDEVTFKNATLERGASRDRAFYDWVMQTITAARGPRNLGLGEDLKLDTFKRDITVFQLDRERKTSIRKHRLFGAWPVAFVAGDWDNGRDEVIIERLTLAYDWFELAQGGDRFPSAVELVPI